MLFVTYGKVTWCHQSVGFADSKAVLILFIKMCSEDMHSGFFFFHFA